MYTSDKKNKQTPYQNSLREQALFTQLAAAFQPYCFLKIYIFLML